MIFNPCIKRMGAYHTSTKFSVVYYCRSKECSLESMIVTNAFIGHTYVVGLCFHYDFILLEAVEF